MNGNGVMSEIKVLLSRGKSSGEIIEVGYRPATVYKVQRQMRRRGQIEGAVASHSKPNVAAITAEALPRSNLATNYEQFWDRVDGLLEKASEVDILKGQLDQAMASNDALSGRVSVLEVERVHYKMESERLDTQLADSFPTCPTCGQGRSRHTRCGYQWVCPPPPTLCTGKPTMWHIPT